jgi:hypothetical protein
MDFFGYLILIGLIYGEAQFLIRMIKFPAHLALLAVMLLDTLIIYGFAMAGALPAGLIFVIVLSLLMAVGAVIKSRFTNTGRWFNLPIAAFLLISFFTFLYTRGTMFYIWDEFSHWGVIYRYLMTVQALPKNLNVIIVTYPPFSPLWQYFVAKVVGFSEANAYFAHMILQFTCIIALFPAEKWSNVWKFSIAILGGILSVFILGFLFQSLYVDLLMALLLAVAFSQCQFEESTRLPKAIMMLLVAPALALTKPTGIELALVAIVVYLASLVRKEKRQTDKQHAIWDSQWLKFGLQAVLILGMTLITWSTWGRFTKDFDYNKVVIQKQSTPITLEESFPQKPDEYVQNLKQQEINLRLNTGIFMQPKITRISIGDIFQSFTLQAPYRTKLIAQNFIDVFSNRTIGSSKVTLKWVLVVILLLTALNALILSGGNKPLRNRYLLVNGMFLLGFLLYAVSLFMTYIVIFYPSEAIGVPSLQRYLGTFLLAWGLMNLAVTFQISTSTEDYWSYKLAPLIIFAFTAGSLLFIPTQQYIHLPPSPIKDQFDAETVYEKVSQVKFTPQDKIYEIYSVMPANYGFKHYVMRYLLAPTASNNEGWSIGKKEGENDVYTADLTPEEWFSILRTQGYTYVLVTISDQEFWDQYRILFDMYSSDYSQPQLFKVTPTGLEFVPLS